MINVIRLDGSSSHVHPSHGSFRLYSDHVGLYKIRPVGSTPETMCMSGACGHLAAVD